MRPHSILSTSACKLASMMFSLTPTVPHSRFPFVDWMSTRVFEAVPEFEGKPEPVLNVNLGRECFDLFCFERLFANLDAFGFESTLGISAADPSSILTL